MEKSKENAGEEEKGNSEIQGQSSFIPHRPTFGMRY